MFYLGLLLLPCTHTEGPRSPRLVGLFILNHRVFRPFVGDRGPSSRTVVPRPGPWSLVPDRGPWSRTVVPGHGPSSLVTDRRPSSRTVVPRPSTHFGIFTLKGPLDVLDSYPTLRLSSLCLSIDHTQLWRTKRELYYTGSSWGFKLGVTHILAFLDTNMLVSPTQNSRVGGITQCNSPT